MAFSPRQYLSNGPDVLNGVSNINVGMLGGNDYLMVDSGFNNFANGNDGEDRIIVRGGLGKYLGGKGNDEINVWAGTVAGSWVNGNNGIDTITGNVDDVTYRGGADNDWLRCRTGNVWGDKGKDVFQALNGEGVANVMDYTPGEDVVTGFSWYEFNPGYYEGVAGLFYGKSDEDMLFLRGITDSSQVTVMETYSINEIMTFLNQG